MEKSSACKLKKGCHKYCQFIISRRFQKNKGCHSGRAAEDESERGAKCSGQPTPNTTLSFFPGPSWRLLTIELMRPDPVVPMLKKMADVALCFLRSSIA